ncbi:probable GPI-anchored adhesin-like protein PGA55 [Miscanthus floridulus]|uniref:probable GPI-anchored adhesin-like protein PGA55 n=1 Tax=Miscanthus floridulus TaxID=154761 RepID=UPI003457CF5F
MILQCPTVRPSGCNGKERKGGDHKAALRQKKLKAKTLKWRSSNSDMNSKVEAGGSDQVCDDAVLCSLSTASFSGLVSWKRVRTLGKVAERCDAVDPLVPRKLRSAINKRAGRFASASSRHVKKRRHLSAISAQISFVDQETRSNGSSLFTEQEEAIADVLLSLSQVPFHSELTADKAIADSSNTNVASTSYSKGPTKEGDQTVVLPSAANELANQSACIDKVVEQTNIVPNVNPVAGTTDQSSNKTPPLSATEQIQDLSMGTAVNLPSPSKDTSNNSTQKQQKVQFDDSKCHPAQKPEAPLWPVNSDKSEGVPHERENAKNNSAQEIAPLVQTPLPCTPAGYLIKPSSSKLAARANTISESTNFTTPGNQNKHPLVKNVGAPKAWKRSITHVYVSHVIQMHVNKEKATASSSQIQAKPEERPLARCSRPPNGGFTTSHKATAATRDEKFYTVHFDVRVPAHQQSSTGICDVGASRQKIVSGGSWQNLPATASSALPETAQHVQYLHHQMAPRPPPPPRDATPYPFPHLPYSMGSLGHAAALQQMPQQYVCSPGYGPRASLPAATSSAMMMKQLQQLMPTQQQMMWQYHVSQYQARPDATHSPASVSAAAAAWHGISSSLRPMGMLAPPALPSPPRPPQMELLCAPYQGGRQPQQLRLM